ncbi:MAG: EamA family transporter [Candidatus Electryonea clarkiae]|nr:EamA family transporter [Candidatus Electryonea clarkiae]MDP8285470.1 EamA family transporter [Candidatus Electryonea clarkiae]
MLSNDSKNITASGLTNLFIVYLVWGSTYLAIRIAVREGSGFPPFMLGATRTLVAGLILFLWNYWRRSRLLPTRNELKILIITGILLWIGGNGLVNWAEQHAHSGYAALLVGTMPMFVAIVEAIVDRRPPSPKFIIALLIGFSGLGVLTYPVLQNGSKADLLSIIALLLAPLSWGIGSVIMVRNKIGLSLTLISGYQQLIGAIAFFLISFLLKEPVMNPTGEAWAAWGYLVIFGSVIAFTAFLSALKALPTSIVMTYAYVNPVIAVFLGWLILSEPVNLWTIAGTVLVLLGVAGVFHQKRK